MVNDKIVQIFSEIADMLDVLGENIFRVRAYRRAAETIRGLGYDLKQMHESDDDSIENIGGIGKDLHAKIIEIIETERCEMHESLVSKLSPGILEILRVRGIGPKKVKLFYEQLDIDSISKLQAAAENGALAVLPGMGEKSENKIIESLAQRTHEQKRIPLDVAQKAADLFVKYMKKCKVLAKIEIAGSLRRGKETIGDIDLLVMSEKVPAEAGSATDAENADIKDAYAKNAAELSKHFLAYKKIKQVLAAGDTKSSVVIEGNLQVDFRIVEPESFGAALFYFTGPKHFNIDVRTLAMKKGWKINEYGVFEGEEKIAGETEKEIFKKLGMDYIEPDKRK